MSEPASFGTHLLCGSLRWDMLRPFPQQASGDRRAGDTILRDLLAYLTEKVNPALIDASGMLPTNLLADLDSLGLLKLCAEPGTGGLGLSPLNAFRVIETMASWTCAGAFLVAIQNGVGAGAYLPAIADGPLRDLIWRQVTAGMISGTADTEPAGAANRFPGTTATLTEDGKAYLLNGEKVFICNAPIATVLCVSATVHTAAGKAARVFCVDTATPGLTIASPQAFMGLHGLSISTVEFRDVRVPSDAVISGAEEEWRRSEQLKAIDTLGRMYITCAPALAIAKLCLHWQREFVSRRRVDGRPLSSYEHVQRIMATCLADVLAMESLIEWCLLSDGTERAFERNSAKNIMSVSCWRVVDLTMSLMAGEGYETPDSKARRGAQPLPLERFYRDARVLRIGGGVDFQVDNWSAQSILNTCFYPPRPRISDLPIAPDSLPLDSRNRDHVLFVAEQARTFAAAAADLTEQYPDPGQLFEHENTMISLNRIADELLTMALVTARCCGHSELDGLANTYCEAARHRLASHWRQLNSAPVPDHGEITLSWLAGDVFDFLLADIITTTPPAR